MVQLETPKKDKLDLATPPPALMRPTVMTAPPPDVVIQATQRTMVATPPVAEPAPPAIAAPVAQRGEANGRDSFIGRLLAQLNRFKQYPAAARKAHIEGVVLLHFVMDASGHVTRAEIQKSSGRPALDNEALALIQRAQPLACAARGFSHPHFGRGGADRIFAEQLTSAVIHARRARHPEQGDEKALGPRQYRQRQAR